MRLVGFDPTTAVFEWATFHASDRTATLTSPTSSGRSIGIVSSRTNATELVG
jgi:hypothetical protein